MKNRVVHALITSIVVGTFIATPVLAAPAAEDTVKAKSQTETQISSAKDQLVDLLVQASTLKQDMENQKTKIEQADKDLADAQAKEQEQYEKMKLRIKYLYENGDSTFLDATLSSKSYADFLNEVEYFQQVHKYDRDKLKEYEKTKNDVEALKEELESQQADMEVMAQSYASQQTSLEKTVSSLKSREETFDSQYAAAETQAATQVEQLAAEREEVQQTQQTQEKTALGEAETQIGTSEDDDAQKAQDAVQKAETDQKSANKEENKVQNTENAADTDDSNSEDVTEQPGQNETVDDSTNKDVPDVDGSDNTDSDADVSDDTNVSDGSDADTDDTNTDDTNTDDTNTDDTNTDDTNTDDTNTDDTNTDDDYTEPEAPAETPDTDSNVSNSALGQQIVDTASGYVGNLNYVWGGTSLVTGADCSGFTQSIFRQFGISIPRTAEDQWAGWGRTVSYADALPGDLVCYSGHVGIYLGDGMMVHSSNPRDGVKISNISYRQWLGFKRYW